MNPHSFFRTFQHEDGVDREEGIWVITHFLHDHEVRKMIFDPDTRIPSHQHSKDVVTLVLEGSIEMRVGTETKTVGSGEVFLVPANTDHEGLILGRRVVAYSFSGN